jgi:hypothetical protein
MFLRKSATGSGLQVPLEGNSSSLVGELDRHVKLPGAMAGGVRTPSGVVVGEAGSNVRGATDVEAWLRSGILQNVNESLVFRHAPGKATPMPGRDVSKDAECARWGRRRLQFVRSQSR